MGRVLAQLHPSSSVITRKRLRGRMHAEEDLCDDDDHDGDKDRDDDDYDDDDPHCEGDRASNKHKACRANDGRRARTGTKWACNSLQRVPPGARRPIVPYTRSERAEKIAAYRARGKGVLSSLLSLDPNTCRTRAPRCYFPSRQLFAATRPRVGGRFVRMCEEEKASLRAIRQLLIVKGRSDQQASQSVILTALSQTATVPSRVVKNQGQPFSPGNVLLQRLQPLPSLAPAAHIASEIRDIGCPSESSPSMAARSEYPREAHDEPVVALMCSSPPLNWGASAVVTPMPGLLAGPPRRISDALLPYVEFFPCSDVDSSPVAPRPYALTSVPSSALPVHSCMPRFSSFAAPLMPSAPPADWGGSFRTMEGAAATGTSYVCPGFESGFESGKAPVADASGGTAHDPTSAFPAYARLHRRRCVSPINFPSCSSTACAGIC